MLVPYNLALEETPRFVILRDYLTVNSPVSNHRVGGQAPRRNADNFSAVRRKLLHYGLTPWFRGLSTRPCPSEPNDNYNQQKYDVGYGHSYILLSTHADQLLVGLVLTYTTNTH